MTPGAKATTRLPSIRCGLPGTWPRCLVKPCRWKTRTLRTFGTTFARGRVAATLTMCTLHVCMVTTFAKRPASDAGIGNRLRFPRNASGREDGSLVAGLRRKVIPRWNSVVQARRMLLSTLQVCVGRGHRTSCFTSKIAKRATPRA